MNSKLDRGPARADLLQGLTGLLLVLFIWGHMLFESSILLGKDAMYWVSKMFEGEPLFGKPYPLLVSAVAAIIFTLIAVHAVLALRKFPASYQQYRQFNSHMGALRHQDTTLWYVQVVTGFAMFFLASAHLLVVFLQPDNIGPYASSDRIWSGRFWILYTLLLVSVHLHAGIGIYRLALKWAPIPAATAKETRHRLKLAMWGIIAFFLCLGTASLLTYMYIGREHARMQGSVTYPHTNKPHPPATDDSDQGATTQRSGQQSMQIIYTDVLVIGGGLAGQRAAIGAKRRGHEVIVLSLVPAKRSHSAAAQGGMQASLGNCLGGEGDNEDIHFADTVRGSDWGADQAVVRMFAHTAPKAIRELAAWGVPWNRVARGEREITVDGQKQTISEPDAAHGLITSRNFGGTEKWRACYVSDGTGHAMLYTMSNQTIAANIPVHERMEAVALLHSDGRCNGAIVRNLMTGELLAYVAKATCIATGGFGRIYRVSTNAIINEGMGAAIALDTGVATLGNMEAIQFHPTGIFPAGILVTEGCRGDGGLLLDGNQHRFMPDYEPEKKELASRDVVSRRMEEHIAAGNGASNRFGDHLWLDIRLLGAQHINNKLREVKEICQYFLGLDPVRELIPVRPAQHYSMGGVRTDHRGESPQLRGLFAAGEAACWDMHGFNRLGGNSVAETVVAGMIVGDAMADLCDSDSGHLTVSTRLVNDFGRREQQRLANIADGDGKESAFELTRLMQETMTANVGIFRDSERLEQAVATLQELQQRSRNIGLRSSAPGANPELVTAYRLQGKLKLAQCVALGALQRTESRGAHYRADYPRRDDLNWMRRTLATWPAEDAQRPALDYEPLDIMQMELPPGWRGYGARDYIEHPDTALRQQQVDHITEELVGADRHARQQAVMPFRHLLPEHLRQNNQRPGDES